MKNLAWLQQLTTLGAAMGALTGVALLMQAGHSTWAAAFLCLPCAIYAGVMAFEFVCLHRVHSSTPVRMDPTPRASARRLIKAWWAEVLMGPQVFAWQQPFRSQRWPDTLPAQQANQAKGPRRRGVLLVHGFFCNRGLWNAWLQRLHGQGTPVVAVNLEPVFGSIDDYVRCIEEAVLRLEEATGLPPVVVAHSMGGLAVRRWWAKPSNLARIHHAISLGTPHQGTWMARFAMSRNARQMRLRSPWLLALAAVENPASARQWTCFYSHCDNIVFPPMCATLAGASNRHLPGVAHVHMVQSREPWEELQRLLVSPAPSS